MSEDNNKSSRFRNFDDDGPRRNRFQNGDDNGFKGGRGKFGRDRDGDREGGRFGSRGRFGRDRDGGRDGGRFGRGRGRFDRDRDGGRDGRRREEREETPPEEEINALFEAQQSTGINFDKYDSIPVDVDGTDVPDPIETFPEMKLHNSLAHNVLRSGYSKPTPVQKYSFPICQANRDLMSCAQTGSGKTAGFLLPLFDTLMKEGVDPAKGRPGRMALPYALIITPTRELANQIYDECRKLGDRSNIRQVAIYGGRDAQKQLNALKNSPHIVIGTPGRLIDMLERGYLGLKNIKYFVLDEADCMLDMGFEPSVRQIVEDFDMPGVNERQTLMFSATFPKEIQRLAKSFLKKDFIYLTVGRVGAAADTVNQTFLEIAEPDKISAIVDLFKNDPETKKAIVFVKRKIDVDEIVDALRDAGYKAVSLHGDKSQQQRERVLKLYKEGKADILVATDVAARGLDIRGVDHVINYDMAGTIDQYVHRIGRTGRVGHTGKATTFFNRTNANIADELIAECEKNGVEVPDFIRALSKRNRGGRGGRFGGRGGGRYGGNGGGRFGGNGGGRFGGRNGGRDGGRGRFNPY